MNATVARLFQDVMKHSGQKIHLPTMNKPPSNDHPPSPSPKPSLPSVSEVSHPDPHCSAELSPLLLLPSYGYSKLNYIRNNQTKLLWPPFKLSASEIKDILVGRLGLTNTISPPDDSITITTDDSDYGFSGLCYPKDLFPFTQTQNPSFESFESLINHLKDNIGFRIGETLFAFPYDWRQSFDNQTILSGLLKKIKDVHSQTHMKLHVLTHGTGGLLFQTLLTLHPKEVYQYVSRWISIACPFQGSADFLQSVLRGSDGGVPFFRFGFEDGIAFAVCLFSSFLISLSSLHPSLTNPSSLPPSLSFSIHSPLSITIPDSFPLSPGHSLAPSLASSSFFLPSLPQISYSLSLFTLSSLV